MAHVFDSSKGTRPQPLRQKDTEEPFEEFNYTGVCKGIMLDLKECMKSSKRFVISDHEAACLQGSSTSRLRLFGEALP